MRIERRLQQPWWLAVVVPLTSIAAAFLLSAVILWLTGHPPLHSFHRLFDAAFIAPGALSDTVVSATPLAFTGLAAAVAFRMNLFNIGGEGQLYAGAITGATIALLMAGAPSPLVIAGMIVAGAVGGALLAAIPAVLRAFLSTNEIITSLMLNYVVGLFLEYLIFSSHSYLRDSSGFQASVFPQGKTLRRRGDLADLDHSQPGLAARLSPGDRSGHPRLGAVRANALRVRGAGDRRLRPGRSLLRNANSTEDPGRHVPLGRDCGASAEQVRTVTSAISSIREVCVRRAYGYTGIVVAALARYNPLAVVPIALLLGGLQNAGFALQGADFPNGLVGVMQGLILFCALGGELFVRYRVRIERGPVKTTPVTAP